MSILWCVAHISLTFQLPLPSSALDSRPVCGQGEWTLWCAFNGIFCFCNLLFVTLRQPLSEASFWGTLLHPSLLQPSPRAVDMASIWCVWCNVKFFCRLSIDLYDFIVTFLCWLELELTAGSMIHSRIPAPPPRIYMTCMIIGLSQLW